MGKASWRGQIEYALNAIDCRGESKRAAKQERGWKLGDAIEGIFSDGTLNTVFDRTVTLTNWIEELYPELRQFCQLDQSIIEEYLAFKAESCEPSTMRTVVANLRKLQEGLMTRHWIRGPIVPDEWSVEATTFPRGPYAFDEADKIVDEISRREPEHGQALRFIRSSGARIDEVFHLRSGKVDLDEGRVELLGKGGRIRRIRLLDKFILAELNLSKRFVYLKHDNTQAWKESLRREVRRACDRLNIRRHAVHGFRATAACEFMRVRVDVLGLSELDARHELAQWLGHSPHRTEVTYAYVSREWRAKL